MKPSSSLTHAVPHLANVEKIDASNFLECVTHISASKFPSKNFTIALIILDVCGYNPRVWQDHLVRILSTHDTTNWTVAEFTTLVTQYIEFVDATEAKAAEFGVHVGDPHAPSV